jgi:hypothetical protein
MVGGWCRKGERNKYGRKNDGNKRAKKIKVRMVAGNDYKETFFFTVMFTVQHPVITIT